MRLSKRILKTPMAQGLLSGLAALYVRFVAVTTRWTVEDAPLRRVLAEGEAGIGCFWHGRLLMMPLAWMERRRLGFQRRAPGMHMMISEHRDGTLIARTIARLGFPTVAADSKKGGMAALRTMKRLLDRGDWVSITPDGPRGPRMRAKSGAIKLAQLSGRPIVPASVAVSRGKVIGSWDRFLLAWPFSHGYMLLGEPIRVPRDADAATLEAARKALEDSLNALTAEADRRCGRTPVTPEPAAPDEASAVPADGVAERA